MAELLKNFYTEAFFDAFIDVLKKYYPDFQGDKFKTAIFDNNWKDKELKQRMRHISQTLHLYLPVEYVQALEILKSTSRNFQGFEYFFFPDYVELYGMGNFQHSMSALEVFTQYSSSEFAVRPFIKKCPEQMMEQMQQWAKSDNHHHRRLASEGCRPRLPWAMALPEFKYDPQAVLKILQQLKNDPSEYVRRSVANNLNDIAKDNPQQVIKLAKLWLAEHANSPDKNTFRLVKHACRSLLKQGNREVLGLFGYTAPKHIIIKEFKLQKSLAMGEVFYFSFVIKTNAQQLGKLRIEYGLDFMKKNGKQARKIFKISESDYTGQTKVVTKHHSFKKISTRKYYPGLHGIAIIINGQELACESFILN
ncbi:MAG: DNA alkylation repair protein [Pseudomonadota bacterium]